MSEAEEAALIGELVATPGLIAEALQLEPQLEHIAHKLARARDVLYLGRGTAYPLALEGALKLKELATSTPRATPRASSSTDRSR